MSAAQEAAQIKNAIFPQPKLTLKTSVLPLNTEEISLRPASFGGPPSKSLSGTKLSGKSKQKSPLTPDNGVDNLTPQMETLSVKANADGVLKGKASPSASRNAGSPKPQSSIKAASPVAVETAAAVVVAPAIPFDEVAAGESLKSVVAKALEELPAETPSTSQRSTPEPGCIGAGGNAADPESAAAASRKATRDRVLEAVSKGVVELGGGGSGIPLSFVPSLLSVVLTCSAESPASRSVGAVIVAALDGVESAVAAADAGKSVAFLGLEALLAQMPSLEATVPKIKSVVANVAAQLVMSEKLTLQQVATPLKGGTHFPLFLLTLQAMVKDPKHKEEAEAKSKVKSLVDQSGVELPEMVPQTSLPNLLSVFSERGLGFLLPLLRLRVELTKVVKEDPSPKALYAWLRDHVDDDRELKASADFIHILTSVLLTYVTEQSTLESSADAPITKEKTEQERLLFAKFSPILKKFVEGDEDKKDDHNDVGDENEKKKKKGGEEDDNDNDEEAEKADVDKVGSGTIIINNNRKSSASKIVGEMQRQIALVYALQVFCHGQKWPKGLLLRLFTYMYDLEVVEEEAFIKWKEDLNDAYPGKGKALFQVNQWLTWLEQAESEEEDEA